MTEAEVLNKLRLHSPFPLWRNNVGVAVDPSGRPIRYGLANDSRNMNRAIKSADLIGINPLIITPEMVGRTIGQFVSIEVKAEGWRGVRTDREKAQVAWADIIRKYGGIGEIVSNVNQFKEILK